MSKTVKAILIVALVGVLGVGLYFLITSQLNARKARSYDEFVQLIMDEKNESGNGGSIEDRLQIGRAHV